MSTRPILLWSTHSGGTGLAVKGNPEYCVSQWLKRKRLAEDIGLELKLLIAKRRLRTSPSFEGIERLIDREPGLFVESPGRRTEQEADTYDNRLSWPRDTIFQAGKKFYSPHQDTGYAKSLLRRLGVSSEVIPNLYGEGGLTSSIPGLLLYADLGTEGRKDIAALENVLECHPLPIPAKPGEELYRRMVHNDHIDTEINCAETPGGNPFIVVNGCYYDTFKPAVDSLAFGIGAKAYVLRDRADIVNRGVNFIQAPGGHVLIASENPETYRIMNRALGRKKVHAISMFPFETSTLDGGGGLRCRTNIFT